MEKIVILLKKVAGTFSIIVGCSIIGLWIMLLMTGQVPELITEPASIYFHIAAELVMAVLLIISGVGLLGVNSWSVKMFTLSAGMVVYSVINSSGYYAQNGNIPMVIMFMVLLLVTLIILTKLLVSKK